MQWSLEPILEGECHAVCALARGSRCDAIAFMDQCEHDNHRDYVGLFAALQRIADHGPPRNEHKFRQVGKNLYEIKTNSTGFRLFCFYKPDEHRVVILTHGWKKGPVKEQNQEIVRAGKLRDEYLSSL